MRFLFVLMLSSTIYIQGQNGPTQISLWDHGAPGFEELKDKPEQAKDYWVKSVHNPSITVYQPEEGKANGTSVLIFPGGGHRLLVYTAEGRDPALYLNRLGITAFVLKYRLGREEGSPYDLNIHPKQDAYRAMRYIRTHSDQWNIDPAKVGVMGFSAGGEVAAMVAYETGNGDINSQDPVEQQNGKPDFQILVYPGPLLIPENIEKDAPPAFIVAAIDDPCCSTPSIKLLEVYHAAGVPAEAHIYSQGGHAFNMGYRSELNTLKTWPDRLTDWLEVNNLLSD